MADPSVREIPEIYDSDDPKEFLAGKVSTYSKRGSELLTISVRMLDRDHAINILDLMIDNYMGIVAKQSSDSDTARQLAIAEEVTT